jgi:hypothetical protein
MQSRTPVAVEASTKSRDQVVDCLMNRLSSDWRFDVQRDATQTTLAFKTVAGNPAWLFTIRDSETGSVVEMRRMHGMVAGLNNAKTCL